MREPLTLDPRKGADVTSSALHFLLYEGLTHLNPDGTISPTLAENITISLDQCTYTFTLKNSTWNNGAPLTSYDFANSWRTILDPSFPSINAHLLYPIKNSEEVKKGLLPPHTLGIETPDEKTLIITLERPTPYFIELTSFCLFYPSHPTLSNGPFTLKQWRAKDKITLIKNPNYWDHANIHLDEIEITIVRDEMTALFLFEKGECDLIGPPISRLPYDALPTLTKRNLIHITKAPGTTVCTFNTEKFPFNHPKIRKALSYALNRKTLIDNITQLNDPIATSLFDDQVPLFTDHNLPLAKQLLAEALDELNLTSLSECTYSYPPSEMNHRIAQEIQQQWKSTLNFSIKLHQCDSKLLLDNLTKGNFDLAQTYWLAQYNDPMNILERFKDKTDPKNFSNWQHPKFISLLEKSHYDNRAECLKEAEALLLSEMPIAPLFHTNFAYLIQPHLKNVQFTPMGTIYLSHLSIDNSK